MKSSDELQKELAALEARLAILLEKRNILEGKLKAIISEIYELRGGLGGGLIEITQRKIQSAKWKEWAETLPQVVLIEANSSKVDLRVEKATAKTFVVVQTNRPGKRETWHHSGRGAHYKFDLQTTLKNVEKYNNGKV